MEKDTIIEEIHKVRKEYAERFGNNLHTICQDAMHKQGRHGRHVVSAIPKPVSTKIIGRNTA